MLCTESTARGPFSVQLWLRTLLLAMGNRFWPTQTLRLFQELSGAPGCLLNYLVSADMIFQKEATFLGGSLSKRLYSRFQDRVSKSIQGGYRGERGTSNMLLLLNSARESLVAASDNLKYSSPRLVDSVSFPKPTVLSDNKTSRFAFSECPNLPYIASGLHGWFVSHSMAFLGIIHAIEYSNKFIFVSFLQRITPSNTYRIL